MKSICLKVMTLLMAALALSASGCFNEMSSPEGTVKGFLKTIKSKDFEKMQSYWNPARVPDKNTFSSWILNYYKTMIDSSLDGVLPNAEDVFAGIDPRAMKYVEPYMEQYEEGRQESVSRWAAGLAKIKFIKVYISNVKTTLVSEKVGKVWKGDKWHPQKQATVEVSYERTLPQLVTSSDNRQDTVNLVKLDNKWYIERWPGFF